MNKLFILSKKNLLIILLSLIGNIFLNAQTSELHLVGSNDCGVDGKQPFLIEGYNYTMPLSVTENSKALTCNYGGKVIYAFDQLDIHADYMLEVVYLADERRTQHIVVDGNEIQKPIVLEKEKLQVYKLELPKKAFAYGQLVLVFEVLEGSNAIVSELNLYSSNPKKTIPFKGESKKELSRTQSYVIDKDVDVEKHIPSYTPKPMQVKDIYEESLSLNGTWMFCENPELSFQEQLMHDKSWKSIIVPGQWSMQGFKVDSGKFGGYQKIFDIPADWKGKQLKLRFDGVSSESVIYMNGTEIGKHMGGMTPFEIDVTDYIKDDMNSLALKVRNESMADMLGSLTQYAAHQLGGITRDVTLFAVPKVYIADIRIETDLDSIYQNAELKIYLEIENKKSSSVSGLEVCGFLEEAELFFSKSIPSISANGNWKGSVTAKVANPKKWDNEHPNLYKLKLNLNENKETIEIIEKRIGFREIEVKGNEVFVNGNPVKLRGVCRHEMHPLTGRVLDEATMRNDVQLYRDANCNFIRTSHYPPSIKFIEICDELGMFVEVEAPVCWIGHHANENWKTLNYREPQYYDYVLQANMEMIQYYRNNPSIIFWSMANESYWNKEFAQVQVYVEKADTTRPFTFHDQAYGGFNNQGSTSPIANIHYPGSNGYKMAAKIDRPLIYGEYCHLNVYNRSELVTDPGIRSDWALALDPTWENMYKTKGILGGSIWSGIDDIFQLPNGDAVGYGAWGPIDGWRRPKPEYWDMRKIYSPVKVKTKKLESDKELLIEVENRYGFTNLNEVLINWQLGKERGTITTEGEPGKTTCFTIPFRGGESESQLLITFTDPRGFIAEEVIIPIGEQKEKQLPVLAKGATKLKKTNSEYIVTGENFVCKISRLSGQIITMKKGGKEIINGGPWLMALPLSGGGCYPNHNANTPIFNDICTEWTLSSIDAIKDKENVLIKVKGDYKEFTGGYELSINGNGEFSVSYSFDAEESVNPRQWGLVFEAPMNFDKTFWNRDGRWSIYPDDHISRPKGEASLFYANVPLKPSPRTEPSWSWSSDANELGSNDFRSTRRNINYAGLKSANNNLITVCSEGNQHWRSWLEGDKVRFLIADFVTAGNEMFLEGYYSSYRKPLKKNDNIKGEIKIRLE